MTRHPDEGTLHAYIDGELPRAEAEALDAHVAGCATCSAALAEARGLVAATSQVITALDAAPARARPTMPAVGRTGASSAPARPGRPLIFRMPYARAAALLLLVGGSAFVADRSGMFDGSSRSVSTAADAVQRTEPVVESVPEAAASAAAAGTLASPAPTDLSTAAVGSVSGAVTRKEASAPRAAANRTTRDGARAMDSQRAAIASTLPSTRQQDPTDALSLKRVESGEGTRAPALAVAPTAPPMAPPPPARAVDAQLPEPVVGAASPGVRVSRYRTKSGTIVTLTEEALRTSFAEESDARRTTAPTAAGAQHPAAAAAPPPVVNSYRWSRPEQGRTYTLTGPLPIAELEALSKRLSELERVP